MTTTRTKKKEKKKKKKKKTTTTRPMGAFNPVFSYFIQSTTRLKALTSAYCQHPLFNEQITSPLSTTAEPFQDKHP